MSEFLIAKNHHWVSFAAKQNHAWCSHRRVDEFKSIYRRNHDDSWILGLGRAHKEMRKQLEDLSDEKDRFDKISLLLAMADAYNSLPRKISATKALERDDGWCKPNKVSQWSNVKMEQRKNGTT